MGENLYKLGSRSHFHSDGSITPNTIFYRQNTHTYPTIHTPTKSAFHFLSRNRQIDHHALHYHCVTFRHHGIC
ncbi:hypothetical protein M0657_010407 [Pyricularia oryzae]|uniref:Uncharacterized protein n=1 Tax=Pyricularia oryzae TaxID=318829 RepID=A0A4P7N1B6_PYROR|nr:hypothetical protein M0657_010407 [Pyricularia oryzae]KAI7929730.1 hypothetical protein M9X92_001188 [Pyricularia oryzae]QBZ54376.1 hypothetical protein PoMZ_10074 [Pyricularia oryzae]